MVAVAPSSPKRDERRQAKKKPFIATSRVKMSRHHGRGVNERERVRDTTKKIYADKQRKPVFIAHSMR